jgi:hypothetical protein
MTFPGAGAGRAKPRMSARRGWNGGATTNVGQWCRERGVMSGGVGGDGTIAVAPCPVLSLPR